MVNDRSIMEEVWACCIRSSPSFSLFLLPPPPPLFLALSPPPPLFSLSLFSFVVLVVTRCYTGAAAYDATLQQQFDALTNLLEDSYPEVRAVAAKVRAMTHTSKYVPASCARKEKMCNSLCKKSVCPVSGMVRCRAPGGVPGECITKKIRCFHNQFRRFPPTH